MSDYKSHQDRWTCTSSQLLEQQIQDMPQYDLLHQLKRIKDEHVKYISKLALCSNSSVVTSQDPTTKNSKANNEDQQYKQHYYLALTGLQLLSNWTAVVTEVYSWKLVNPNTQIQIPNTKIEDYERATRYNYNSKEKFALVEIIGMIKGLQVYIIYDS